MRLTSLRNFIFKDSLIVCQTICVCAVLEDAVTFARFYIVSELWLSCKVLNHHKTEHVGLPGKPHPDKTLHWIIVKKNGFNSSSMIKIKIFVTVLYRCTSVHGSAVRESFECASCDAYLKRALMFRPGPTRVIFGQQSWHIQTISQLYLCVSIMLHIQIMCSSF